MLDVKTKGLLLNIITHCKRIEEKTDNCNNNSFVNDRDINDIVCFNLLQIGELVKGLDNELITTYNKIPWNKVKGMRDRIVHGYGSIDLNRVWLTAIEDVRPLREYCEKIISDS